MDYEKAYKEALVRAKEIQKVNYADSPHKEIAEYIFPVLAESEDEKIRKELLNYLYDVHDDDEERSKWIAYLEKKGEQKPENYDHEMWKNCQANFEGGKNEVLNNPEKYGLLKSVEWSDEDEEILIDGIILLSNECSERGIRLRSWLKSLKDRVLPQPKQEWSEEDKKMLGILFEMIDYASDHYQHDDKATDIKVWVLKSIYPQNQKHWKPTEEQMRELHNVFGDASGGWDDRVIESLYNDLKAL